MKVRMRRMSTCQRAWRPGHKNAAYSRIKDEVLNVLSSFWQNALPFQKPLHGRGEILPITSSPLSYFLLPGILRGLYPQFTLPAPFKRSPLFYQYLSFSKPTRGAF